MFRSSQNMLPNVFFVQTHTQDEFFDVIVREGNNQEEELQMSNKVTGNKKIGTGSKEEEEEEEDEDMQTRGQNDLKIDEFKNEIIRLESQLSQTEAELRSFRQKASNETETFQRYKTQAQQRIADLQQDIANLSSDVERYTSDYADLSRKYEIFTKKWKTLTSQNETLTAQNQQLTEQISEKTKLDVEHREELEKARKRNESLQRANENMAAHTKTLKLEKENFENEKKKMKTRIEELEQAKAELIQKRDNELAILNKQHENLRGRKQELDSQTNEIETLKQEKDRLTSEVEKKESKIKSLTTENTNLQDVQSQKALAYESELKRLTLELANTEQSKREKALELAVASIDGLIESNPIVSLSPAERNAIRLICKKVLEGGVSGEKPAGGGRASGAKGIAKPLNTPVAKSSAKPLNTPVAKSSLAKPAGSDSVAGGQSSGFISDPAGGSDADKESSSGQQSGGSDADKESSSGQLSGGSEADQGSSPPSRSNSSGSRSDGLEVPGKRQLRAGGIKARATAGMPGGSFETPPSASSEDDRDNSANGRVDPTDMGGSAKASHEGSASTSDGSRKSFDPSEASSEAHSEPEAVATIGLTGRVYGKVRAPGAADDSP